MIAAFSPEGARRLIEQHYQQTKYPWSKRVEVHADNARDFAPRSEWGEGPWQQEPDLIEWRHETGLPLLMTRGPSGSWCGYVGLPPTHPSFGKNYDQVPDNTAHGGLTFANECGGHICHVAEPGEHREVWWVGFDCAHGGDLSPGMDTLRRRYDGGAVAVLALKYADLRRDEYRDVDYVRANVEELAAELTSSPTRLRGRTDLGRERWFDPMVGGLKRLLRKELPQLWREMVLERDHWGRGPEEREMMESCYGKDRWADDGLRKVALARRRDRFWRWSVKLAPWEE